MVGYFLGKWSVVGGAWSVVGGRWSVVGGWSVGGGFVLRLQQSTDFHFEIPLEVKSDGHRIL